jgi:hypothetical protein
MPLHASHAMLLTPHVIHAFATQWCERELGVQESQLQAALKSEPQFSRLVTTGEELQRRFGSFLFL